MAFQRVLKAVFGDRNERELKALGPLVVQINALEDRMRALDDAGLRGCTAAYRERLAQGEALDALLPEAFATARESARRTLGQRPYDVQLLGGIVLHQGKIGSFFS